MCSNAIHSLSNCYSACKHQQIFLSLAVDASERNSDIRLRYSAVICDSEPSDVCKIFSTNSSNAEHTITSFTVFALGDCCGCYTFKPGTHMDDNRGRALTIITKIFQTLIFFRRNRDRFWIYVCVTGCNIINCKFD